jgi:hypothetical protein
MVFGSACFVSLVVLSTAVPSSKVDDVVNNTRQVIGTLQNESVAAKQQFANTAKIDWELDKIGRQADADFDMKLYKKKNQEFAKLAQRSMDESKKSEYEANVTIAEELLEQAEEARNNMTKVDEEIDSMEKELHDKLQQALVDKLAPDFAIADNFTGQASHLEAAAHSMMDPLYSWGDAAEDKADRLNDQTNDALSSVEKVVRTYVRHIRDHARTVQRNTERKLFRPGQDRVAVSRKVQMAVQSASGHVAVQKYLATTSLWGLPLGSSGGLTLLLIGMVAAAAVGVVVASFVVKSRASLASEYRHLPA